MNDEDWAVDDEALNNVNEAVCMTKTAAEVTFYALITMHDLFSEKKVWKY